MRSADCLAVRRRTSFQQPARGLPSVLFLPSHAATSRRCYAGSFSDRLLCVGVRPEDLAAYVASRIEPPRRSGVDSDPQYAWIGTTGRTIQARTKGGN